MNYTMLYKKILMQQLRDKQHSVNPWIIKYGLRTVIKNDTLPKDFYF